MIPTLEQAAAYAVNRPGQVEAIRQSLYDFLTYAQAGQSSLSFFQVPVGQGGKTLADTNMEAAGSLPNPKRFLLESIEIHFIPLNPISALGADAAFLNLLDTWAVGKSGWLNLFIGSKSYLTEAPLMRFPPTNGLLVSSMADSQTTPAAALQTKGDYVRFGGKPYAVDPPIFLEPTQNFNVTLNWPALVTVTVAARIGVVMNGVLYRNSQ
jgi:hypothetical protein